jgi:hypothetical protein
MWEDAAMTKRPRCGTIVLYVCLLAPFQTWTRMRAARTHLQTLDECCTGAWRSGCYESGVHTHGAGKEQVTYETVSHFAAVVSIREQCVLSITCQQIRTRLFLGVRVAQSSHSPSYFRRNASISYITVPNLVRIGSIVSEWI